MFKSIIDGFCSLFRNSFNKMSALEKLSEGMNGMAYSLNEISTSIDRLAYATQEVAESIIEVEKHGDALKAQGYIERAGKSLKAGVLDVAKQDLDRASRLDSSNWALWIGLVWWRVSQVPMNNHHEDGTKILPSFTQNDITTLENAIRYVSASDEIQQSRKKMLLYALFGTACLYNHEQTQNLAMRSIVSIIESEESLDFNEYAVQLTPLMIHSKKFKGNSPLKSLIPKVDEAYISNIKELQTELNSCQTWSDNRFEVFSKNVDSIIEKGDGIVSDNMIKEAQKLKTEANRIQGLLKDYEVSIETLLEKRGELQKKIAEFPEVTESMKIKELLPGFLKLFLYGFLLAGIGVTIIISIISGKQSELALMLGFGFGCVVFCIGAIIKLVIFFRNILKFRFQLWRNALSVSELNKLKLEKEQIQREISLLRFELDKKISNP